jgi:23S rRNA pseudouridine2605 synthase
VARPGAARRRALKGRRRTLDRTLSRAGAATREGAARAIRDGRVTVGGAIVRDPATWIDPERDEVRLDGEIVLPLARTELVLLNKPRGVVTTLSDPEGRPTVRDLLPAGSGTLRPVGRLDRASAGLLLLTNDTDLAERLLDPAEKIEKEYRVKLRPPPDEPTLAAWRRGVDIGDETPTRPAQVEIERAGPKSAVLRIVLREGRNRQIRRMAAAAGCEVEWLVRVRIGPIELGELPPGGTRDATTEERRAIGIEE